MLVVTTVIYWSKKEISLFTANKKRGINVNMSNYLINK